MATTQQVWKKLDVLGSGGFGQVSLWENVQTHEKIAIKVCRQIKAKHLHRWEQEVEIMQSLNHDGLVRFHEVPSEVKASFGSNIIALGMEYCEKGDLRRMLVQPENCCGLDEREVRAVLGDIGSAINYLHDNSIVHRDLKPENIVLKSKPNFTMAYKIIDLGYAKDLSEQTWAKSFVGTPHYLAPEFFRVQPLSYTATVDFWSFGLVVFECITGRRPFYPHLETMQFLSNLRERKRDSHICTINNDGADPQYSTEIPQPHNLNSIFESRIKDWLKCMLLLDPNRRGNLKGQENWYSQLKEILSDRVVEVFDVGTRSTVPVQINADTNVALFKKNLEDNLRFPVSDQILLFKSGEALHPTLKVLNQFDTKQERMLYLSSYQLQSKPIDQNTQIPDDVSSFLAKSQFNPKHMKRVLSLGTNCVAKLIKMCLQSVEACFSVLFNINKKYFYFLGCVTMFNTGIAQDIEACREPDDDNTGAINTDELYTQLMNDRENVATWEESVKREFEKIMQQSHEDPAFSHKDIWTELLKQRQQMLKERLVEAYKKHEVLKKQIREATAHEHRPNNSQPNCITGSGMVDKLKEHILNFVYPTVKQLKEVDTETVKTTCSLLKTHERFCHLAPGCYKVAMTIQHYTNEMQKMQQAKQTKLWSLIAFMRGDIVQLNNCLTQFSPERVEDEMNHHIDQFDSFVKELHEDTNVLASLDWNFDPKQDLAERESTEPATRHAATADDVL